VYECDKSVHTHIAHESHKCEEITRGCEILNKHIMFMVRAVPEVLNIGFFLTNTNKVINRLLNQQNKINEHIVTVELF